MYSVAVTFIRNTDIFEVDLKKASLTCADYLKYFYYCGVW